MTTSTFVAGTKEGQSSEEAFSSKNARLQDERNKQSNKAVVSASLPLSDEAVVPAGAETTKTTRLLY